MSDPIDSISSLQLNIQTLEKTLAAEIRRRVESSRHLQNLFSDQIHSVKSSLEDVFSKKLQLIDDSRESLNARISALERDFTFQREKYLAEIDERHQSIKDDLATTQSVISKELEMRAGRDTLIMDRILNSEQKIQAVISRDKQIVDQKLTLLRDSLLEYKKLRDQGDSKFQQFVVEEIASLKNAVVVETQSREQADDDIVTALNHYTKTLQEALRIVR